MLQEQVAIVTGGSRGVGKGIAQELRARGATVYVTGRTFGPDASADGCIPVVCDHRDDEQVRAMFDRVRAGHDRIDVLVNNAAQKHIGNVAYGVSKAATDKMTADMAHELRNHDVAVVSLYPGLVRTEKVMEAAAYLDLTNSESPRFVGRAVAALASDPQVIARSGSVVVAAALAREYGFSDVDGRQPSPLTLAQV